MHTLMTELMEEPRSPMPPSPDRQLVIRAQGGDEGAFAELYRANVGRVYAVCLRITANTQRAEEFTQETFVRAWEMLGHFRGESAFATWLHRIAVNTALMVIRADRRRNARVEVDEQADPPGLPDDPHSRMDLERAIATLPPQARAVFVLHDIEGYRHEEIAEAMDIASGTSKSQLHRARKLLKEELQ
jgi:RNA polymerase sigma-70 factor (ECF subfamily)